MSPGGTARCFLRRGEMENMGVVCMESTSLLLHLQTPVSQNEGVSPVL